MDITKHKERKVYYSLFQVLFSPYLDNLLVKNHIVSGAYILSSLDMSTLHISTILYILQGIKLYTNAVLRLIITWFMISICFTYSFYLWGISLLFIEFIRLIPFTIPLLLPPIINHLEPDIETLINKVLESVWKPRNQAIVCISKAIWSFLDHDMSQPFTDERRKEIVTFLSSFARLCVVSDKRHLAVFFPAVTTAVVFTRKDIFLRKMKLSKSITGICAICREDKSNPSLDLNCGHGFCFDCIVSWFEINLTCPVCRN